MLLVGHGNYRRIESLLSLKNKLLSIMFYVFHEVIRGSFAYMRAERCNL